MAPEDLALLPAPKPAAKPKAKAKPAAVKSYLAFLLYYWDTKPKKPVRKIQFQ